MLPLGGSRQNIAMAFGTEKLEQLGYPMAKKVWRYDYSFWQNSWMWLTDRQTHTDRQTDTTWRHRLRLWIASCSKNQWISYSSELFIELFAWFGKLALLRSVLLLDLLQLALQLLLLTNTSTSHSKTYTHPSLDAFSSDHFAPADQTHVICHAHTVQLKTVFLLLRVASSLQQSLSRSAK